MCYVFCDQKDLVRPWPTAGPGACTAPQYVAEELLKIEGFMDVQYVEGTSDELYSSFAVGKYDVTMAFVAPFIIRFEGE